MVQKINKLLPIVGIGILSETLIHILQVYTTYKYKEYFNGSWMVVLTLLAIVANYTYVLIFAKRAGIFEKNTFPVALFNALLICTPIIVLSPMLTILYWIIVNQGFGSVNLSSFLPALFSLLPDLLIIYTAKFVLAFVITFIFSIRLDAIIGISAGKELQLYGATTNGVIYRKWRQRHVWLVQAEYYVNGRRYETASKIDRSNIICEKDSVTILYSTQNPYLSAIKEVTHQKVSIHNH